MSSYTISHEAYLKIILHAAKYPSSIVNGIVLGSPPSARSSGPIEIVDSIPLLHHWTSLSPSMEIGLELAEFHASSKDLAIIGYYQADERLDGKAEGGGGLEVGGSLSFVGSTVASRIWERNGKEGVALLIDNQCLLTASNPLVALLPSSSPSSPSGPRIWSPSSSTSISLSNPDSAKLALDAVRSDKGGSLAKFGDFDNHLEDVSVDWLNNREAVKAASS